MSEALINKGISVFGQPNDSVTQPIVVIGTARGGTSMVAGALAKLGVFMGDRAAPPVYEDVRLSELFETQQFKEVTDVALEYTARGRRWGWKRPSSINYLDKVDELLSGQYIFIYKDIASIAQRNSISMLSEIVPQMEMALNQYKNTLSFLKSKQTHAMLVSYDKVVSHPEHFVQALIDFCKLSPSKTQVDAAIHFIRPNPADYLDASRITKAQGRLGGVAGQSIFGWARHVHKKDFATVDLFVNDQPIGSVIANQFRTDLDEKFKQSCAYSFSLPNDIKLKHGDVVRARVVNEVVDLDNSPLHIE